MAEKIGFITFSAFDYQKSTEFDARKGNSYDTANPTQSFFERNPAMPPWKKLSQIGNEPMKRLTPPEFQPLMNEYHRYFLENAVKNEAYLRWVRRHRAWDRETEVVFGRFEQLRDHLNDRFAVNAYAQRGRLNQIFDHAMRRTWMNSEALISASATEAREQKIRSAKALQVKLEEQARYRDHAYKIPDERQIVQKREDPVKVLPPTRDIPIPLNANFENSWSHGLAIAHYQQQMQQSTIAPATLNTNSPNGLPSTPSVPLIKKVAG